MPDLLDLCFGLSQIGSLAAVAIIPYSFREGTARALSKSTAIVRPTLQELGTSDWWIYFVGEHVPTGGSFIICEVGGYAAAHSSALERHFPGQLLGIVEDTEAGHKRYAERHREQPYQIPVISVARCNLKKSEDRLIGPACAHAIERLFRDLDRPIIGSRAVVIGYGKIGRSVAGSLSNLSCATDVLEIDPVRRIRAISDGFRAPGEISVCRDADIIVGCTGTQSIGADVLDILPDGAVVASASSRQVEINLNYLSSHPSRLLAPEIRCYNFHDDRRVILLGEGRPINFLVGSVCGPLIALVQGAIVAAVSEILRDPQPGLRQLDPAAEQRVASAWCDAFISPINGHYSKEIQS